MGIALRAMPFLTFASRVADWKILAYLDFFLLSLSLGDTSLREIFLPAPSVNSFSRPPSPPPPLFLPTQLDKDQQGTETDVIPHPRPTAASNGRAPTGWVRRLHVSSQVELPFVVHLLILVTIL